MSLYDAMESLGAYVADRKTGSYIDLWNGWIKTVSIPSSFIPLLLGICREISTMERDVVRQMLSIRTGKEGAATPHSLKDEG